MTRREYCTVTNNFENGRLLDYRYLQNHINMLNINWIKRLHIEYWIAEYSKVKKCTCIPNNGNENA